MRQDWHLLAEGGEQLLMEVCVSGALYTGSSQETSPGLPPTEHISMVILEMNPLISLES